MDNWKNQTVLITGGSSGIGLELSKKIILYVDRLIIFDKKKLNLSQITKSRVNKQKIIFCLGDISSTKDVKKLPRILINHNIVKIDILINNAGFAHYRFFKDLSFRQICSHANVNFVGFLKITKICLPYLLSSKADRKYIINNASVASEIPITPNSVYGGAKAGMLHFSKLLNYELNPFNIYVKTILPGRVETNFFDHISYKIRGTIPESKMTTTVSVITNILINTISSSKIVFYAPKYWGLISFLLKTNFLKINILYNYIIKKRVARYLKSL